MSALPDTFSRPRYADATYSEWETAKRELRNLRIQILLFLTGVAVAGYAGFQYFSQEPKPDPCLPTENPCWVTPIRGGKGITVTNGGIRKHSTTGEVLRVLEIEEGPFGSKRFLVQVRMPTGPVEVWVSEDQIQ